MSLADRLAARTLELVDHPSESRDEAALAAHVLGVLREGGADARDAGDTCVLAGATQRGERPLVLLAGHFDTVPAQGNRPGRRDADAVHGLGAADMKGALAVMVELALAQPAADVDLGYVFFGREELAVTESALAPLLEREPGLRRADLVVVMEPTANAIHAGCLGNINATWTFHGRSGHSARPWLADNAIHRAAAGIHALAQVPPAPRDFDGLRFTEVVSVTKIAAGIAANVIPDEAVAHVNYRYAPDRTRRAGGGLAARAVRALRHADDRRQRPQRSGGDRQPARAATDRRRRARGAGQAGMDPGRRVRRRRHRRRELRARRPGSGPHPRRARGRRRARALLRDDRGLRVRVNPVLAGMANYPFLRLDRGQARRRWRAGSTSSTSASESRAR